eukprot:Colp12_sorted_trinity150504_noHs@26500
MQLLHLLALGLVSHALGYSVLVDVNTINATELARANKLAADGIWFLSVNSPGIGDGAWQKAIRQIAPSGFAITEDNPGSFSECQKFKRLTGQPPSGAFGYYETGGADGGTILSDADIDRYHAQCQASVIILTRAYWPGSQWRARTDHALANAKVSGVAIEYNPEKYDQRNAIDLMNHALSLKKRVFLLWPVVFNKQTVLQNIVDAITQFRNSGAPMHSPEVVVVLARYDQPHVPWFGSGNSVLQALDWLRANEHT